ncbi:hypothetical protein MK805_01805 [Shimazuella sp. AN120528]|uniref:hypothetical protein n=1 Tax=Shimazuella soli TaxID=1892854 RepID=UPI001F0FE168|nr:hypothetical protein [Shimazuella soli]MCH5583706.1 hypothetical protein [Shimazuella soli]
MVVKLNGLRVNRTEFMIWQYQNSITKRKILQTWRRDKQKFLRSLIWDKNTNNHTPSYAIQFYKDFKSLLYQSYSEEFPKKEPNLIELCDWFSDNASICRYIGNEKDENTWLDIRKCARVLIDGQLP